MASAPAPAPPGGQSQSGRRTPANGVAELRIWARAHGPEVKPAVTSLMNSTPGTGPPHPPRPRHGRVPQLSSVIACREPGR